MATTNETWAENAQRNLAEALKHLARARVHLDALRKIIEGGAR